MYVYSRYMDIFVCLQNMNEKIIFRTKQKRSKFEKLFEDDHVLVHLDSRTSANDVPCPNITDDITITDTPAIMNLPEHLKNNPAMTLKMSHLFQGTTTWDDEKIVALLKFNGSYHRCIIPWSAIWGMTSFGNEQILWHEDMPREVIINAMTTKLRELGSRFLGKLDTKAPVPPEIKKEEQNSTNLNALEGNKNDISPDKERDSKRRASISRIK